MAQFCGIDLGLGAHPQSWRLHARCGSLGEYYFFAPDNEHPRDRWLREQAAKRICARCPVALICRSQALDNNEAFGIWGGLSESDRR